jgi:hypothetical protein
VLSCLLVETLTCCESKLPCAQMFGGLAAVSLLTLAYIALDIFRIVTS